MQDRTALRAEARKLFELARRVTDEAVVAQIHALAWELQRLAADGERRPSNGG